MLDIALNKMWDPPSHSSRAANRVVGRINQQHMVRTEGWVLTILVNMHSHYLKIEHQYHATSEKMNKQKVFRVTSILSL